MVADIPDSINDGGLNTEFAAAVDLSIGAAALDIGVPRWPPSSAASDALSLGDLRGMLKRICASRGHGQRA